MKKKLIYICVLCCSLLWVSCVDNIFTDFYNGDGVRLKITVNVPGESLSATRAIQTRAGGTNQYDNGTDDNTALQYAIGDGDIYVLVFENTSTNTNPVWSLYAVPSISENVASSDGTMLDLTCIMPKPDATREIIIDVVANLVQNGVYSSTSVAETTLQGMVGYTRETVYSSIGTFAYPENSEENPYGVWTLDADNGGRYLPMWGQSYVSSNNIALQTYSVSPASTDVEATCGLYRSVAKMGVMIDSACETFQLKEIYVYYPNNAGTFVSLPVESGSNSNWTNDKTIQFTLPEVPTSAVARSIEYPLVYKLDDALTAGGEYLNNIYVTEADNTAADNPVCLVVGGYYLGGNYEGEGLSNDDYPLDYYRIDLTSTATGGTTQGGVFDIIRNHSYIFNILNANSPGTSDPDPRRATAGLEVEILDYTEVSMHGINSQYTLNVNQSLFAFEGTTAVAGELIINTDGEGWELVTEWTTEEGYPETGATEEWLHVTDTSAHTNVDDVVYIEPDANVSIANDDEETTIRHTSFWIKCGRILKEINIVQDVTETGNTYIVQPGSYSLKVDIRGNGNTSAWTNDNGDTEEIDFGMGYTIDDVAYVAVIWETAEGFVTIDDPTAISASGCISYTVNNVSLDGFGDWTGRVFDPGNGANALIGVYDSSYNLVWTYHIWALGDYVNGELTEDWTVGSAAGNLSTYSFMDRNLGAYSNLPGSKSFGLLYQWGRKDPFIGAYYDGEQDYHQVRKQYTRHYVQPNGQTYTWGDFDDSTYGNTSTGEGDLMKYLVQNPTTLMQDGLLSSDHNGDEAKGLWGTESYNYDANELGNKTMYDPCPPGYRVPSLNALTVWDGTNNLWNSGTHSSRSCRYVPVPNDGSDFRTGNGSAANFVSDAPFYGFWLDYANGYGFNTMYGNQQYGVNYYSEANIADGTYGWVTGYENSKPAAVTWIPLAGIYNGSMDHFGRAGLTDRGPGGSEPYLPSSSLQVTSVLWANSPTQNNTNYPGGLLLHGTEGAYAPHQANGTSYYYSPGEYETASNVNANTVATEGEGYWHTGTAAYSTNPAGWWTGSVDNNSGTWNGNNDFLNATWSDENGFDESGRHFHSYIESNASVYANPSYAASVRCIRDKDAVEHVDDVIRNSDGTDYTGTTLDLYQYGIGGGSGTGEDYIELAVFFIEEWEVVSPGAKWVSVSPSSGTTSSSSGATDTIRITYNTSVGVPEVGATATIIIGFARGGTAEITIRYVGETRTN